jgi:hypothetical protein
VQFDFAGPLALADGRYLARRGAGEEESVLVLQTLGTSSPPRRRRRRSQPSDPDAEPAPLPLARATAIRAFAPFDDSVAAERWLEGAASSEEETDVVVGEGIDLLNRALHAQAVAAADPFPQALPPERAVAVRLGYGSGEQTASGEYTAAREVDVRATGASRRQRRQEDLRPQERVAGVLSGRERLDACESLLLRARADLDAGRAREAALQLRVGLEALLVELHGALADPGHEADMTTLTERRHQAGVAANAALGGELTSAQDHSVRELLALCERVVRRRRVLRG